MHIIFCNGLHYIVGYRISIYVCLPTVPVSSVERGKMGRKIQSLTNSTKVKTFVLVDRLLV